MAACEDERVDVEFCIRSALTAEPGLEMAVLGSAEALGAWDVTRATPMQRAGDEDWRLTVALPAGELVAYKYLILRDGRVESWEAIPGNRAVYPGVRNASRGRAARQSSTYESPGPHHPGPRAAATAVNGRTLGSNEHDCAHTNREREAWWEVALDAATDVDSVVVWNRRGRCAPRLAPFWVLLLPSASDGDGLAAARRRALAAERFESVQDMYRWRPPAGTPAAAVVRVQLEGENWLHVAEVQVFERVREAAASESSTYRADGSHSVNDGLFGEQVSWDDPDAELYHDSAWLSPAHGAELRLMLGTREGVASVQMVGAGPERPVRVAMTVVDEGGYTYCGAWRRKLPMAPTRLEPEPESAPTLMPRETSYHSERRRPRAQRLDTVNANINAVISQTQSQTAFEVVPAAALAEAAVEAAARLELLQGVGADTLRRWLGGAAEWRRYEPGSIIVTQGQPRQHFFVLLEGEAAVTVRESAVLQAEREVKRLQAVSAFGEMALVTGGLRTANVRAGAAPALIAVLTRDSFVAALGRDAYRGLVRAAQARSRRVPVRTVLSRADQSEEAVSAEAAESSGVFAEGDVQIFAVNLGVSQQIRSRVLLEVFDGESLELLGAAHLLPSHLTASMGLINCPIVAPGAEQRVVGELFAQYLITTPLVVAGNSLENVWRTHWPRTPRILDVGHRGLGASHHPTPTEGYRPTTIRENTLMSFVVAGRLGADYVEFDVQLTADRVPVIYHDFFIDVQLQEELTDLTEPLTLGVHQLTRRQLQRCKVTPLSKRRLVLRDLIRKHWSAILALSRAQRGASPTSSPSHARASRGGVRRKWFEPQSLSDELLARLHLVPTLQALFRGVPEHVGFNVEIKYPCKHKERHLRESRAFEMNAYLDTILACVFREAGARRLFFSCFDPDICTMLRAKQARYPVLFLTNGGTMPDSAHYADTRCLSLDAALSFVASEGLQGIVTDSRAVIENPGAVRAIKSSGLLLFTYGSQNNSADMVTMQKQLGVDGVISDNVNKLSRAAGKVRGAWEDTAGSPR